MSRGSGLPEASWRHGVRFLSCVALLGFASWAALGALLAALGPLLAPLSVVLALPGGPRKGVQGSFLKDFQDHAGAMLETQVVQNGSKHAM